MPTKITLSHAIENLFKITLAKESPYLKDKLNSFVRNGLIKHRKEGFKENGDDRRQKVYLESDKELIVIHNALILNAFYPAPSHVKTIFEKTEERQKAANEIQSTVGCISSMMIQLVISSKLTELIDMLRADVNLRETKLPNPFSQLPQLAVGNSSGLLQILLAQASALAPLDSVLGAIMKKDWLLAQQLITKVESTIPGIDEITQLIDKELKNSIEFDEVLDFFKNI